MLSPTMHMRFYAIHAALLHHDKTGSLAAFVIATSAGMIAAGPLWHRVGQSSIRMVLFLGPTMHISGQATC